MRKKLISMLLCATMVATMTTGCGDTSDDGGNASSSGAGTSSEANSGGSADNSGGSDETVTLTLWAAEEDQDFAKERVEKFKAAYPDTNFDISIGVESESTAKDTVLTDIEAAADVYSFASDQLADLVNAGALAELNEDVDTILSAKAGKSLDDVKSSYVADSVDAASVDGKLYAFPATGANTYFLYYDSSAVTAEDAATWDTLLAAAQKAGKKVGMTFNSGWYNASFFYGAGFTTDLNADGTTAIDWDGTSPDGYTGVDVVKSMLDIASNSAFQPMTSDNGSNLIASGDLCAAVSGTWDAEVASKVWGDNYAAIKLPTFKVGDDDVQMRPAYGYKFEAVNAYSKNLGWAALLAEFMTNEESQVARFEQRGEVPTNNNALQIDSLQTNIAVLAAVSEGDIGVVQKVGGKYWDPAATFGELIAKGKLSTKDDAKIQEALDSLISGVTAPLS